MQVWAVIMCYDQLLGSQALVRKARAAPRATLAHPLRGARCTVHVSHHRRHSQADILKKRARGIHESMDAAFWEEVSTAQRSRTDYWEPHRSDDGGGSLVWHNYVTDEKRTERPAESTF